MGKPNDNLTDLISVLQERIENADIGDYDGFSWGYETGVLISGSTADGIMEHLKRINSDAFDTTLEIQKICTDIIKEFSMAKINHPETDNFDINKMALVMTEEAGEVAKAVLQYQDEDLHLDEVRSELIQTAAMCIRMLLATKDYKPKYK